MRFEVWAAEKGGVPYLVKADAIVATKADAEAFAATMPKWLRVVGSSISGSTRGSGYISFHVNFAADAVNGGKNEAGMKRLKKFLSLVEWEYQSPFLNSVSEAAFRSFVGREAR